MSAFVYIELEIKRMRRTKKLQLIRYMPLAAEYQTILDG
jgi:predicted GIY-YIG superfamily endonuclease